ncbi:MAG TPA: glycerophosphoryl diester phosphodiesterase membrane domain-containing protein [Streptosporangiaceae bacterium]|nr:glycerophosphoryl diester phosphodiesterase membrane domain-containing protein [Streptosporangiaceae bacterium]
MSSSPFGDGPDLPPAGQPGNQQGFPPGYGPQGYGPQGYGQQFTAHGWPAPAPTPGGVPLRPLSAGDILSGTFTLIRRNPVATLGLAAVVETLSGVLVTLLSWAEQPLGRQLKASLGPYATPGQVGQAVIHYLGSAVPYFLVTLVLSFFVQNLLTGMLTGALGEGLIGRKITIGEAFRMARVLGVIAITSIILAILLGMWLVLIAIVVVLAVAKLTTVATLVGGFGLAGAIIVTIWLAVRLAVAVPAVVLEGVRPVTALARSWRLVRGHWWRVFGIALLGGLVTAVIGSVLTLPFSVARVLLAGAHGSTPFTLNTTAAPGLLALVIGGIGGIIAATCTRPISAGVTVLIYADLRMRKEGLDLALQQAAQAQGVPAFDLAQARQPGPGQGTGYPPMR